MRQVTSAMSAALKPAHAKRRLLREEITGWAVMPSALKRRPGEGNGFLLTGPGRIKLPVP